VAKGPCEGAADRSLPFPRLVGRGVVARGLAVVSPVRATVVGGSGTPLAWRRGRSAARRLGVGHPVRTNSPEPGGTEDEAIAKPENKQFDLRGVNHLALVCKDMARTVGFYSNVLGMPLTKTIELPGGMGQHFFFDIGGGDALAFFWFPESPERAPGIAAPARMVGEGSIATAHGSMNHVAFDVAPEKMEEYRERLQAKGIEVTEIVNHDNSPMQVSAAVTDDVFVRSM